MVSPSLTLNCNPPNSMTANMKCPFLNILDRSFNYTWEVPKVKRIILASLVNLHLSPAFAIRAGVEFQRLNGLSRACAGHLHQPQGGNAVDLGLGMVLDQLLTQGIHDPALMVFPVHVNE